jgi:dienelactone hydrolase
MTMIGAYGPWMATIVGDEPARLSFRRAEWTDLEAWRRAARQRVFECLAMPNLGGLPEVTVSAHYTYDGLHVEEMAWQLPYGPPTQALLLKPEGSTGRLPGILALHDHATNKYFGKRKIARTCETWHPSLFETHAPYYGGVAWANEIARRGYVVLVHDGFTFGSRRVRLRDVPEGLRGDLCDTDVGDEPDNTPQIQAYNRWAAGHESTVAKALLALGTTWPGVFLAEDQRALDVLCARDDVDATRVGIGGLSGGGLRTVYLGGLDPRVRCAVCVGQMTTWRDYALNVSALHSWMAYIPLVARDLDYPEILGLRVPMPTLVLNNNADHLFSLPEMRRADEMLRQVYARAGAPERCRCSYYAGGHKFDLAMQAEAFDWFDRWLQKGQSTSE